MKTRAAAVRRAIVAENAVISANAAVGEEGDGLIAVVGQDAVVPEGGKVAAGEQFGED